MKIKWMVCCTLPLCELDTGDQRLSDYFGPLTQGEVKNNVIIDPAHAAEGEDWWPKMVMLKVLQQYYSATEDKRVIKFMSKYFRYQVEALKKAPIGRWTEWALVVR